MMSSKEIKAELKAAKTAIQAKDYNKALEHCNIILSKDEENYNALVFAGLSYSETNKNEDARGSYRKAIKSHPDQILAYQGLANLYAKHWKSPKTKDDVEELIGVYEKLSTVVDRKDAKKRIELVVNFCDVLIENSDFVKVLATLSAEAKEFENQEKDTRHPLFHSVFKVLAEVKAPSTIGKFCGLIDESFSCLVQSEVQQVYLREYLAFLRGNVELLQERVPTILDTCINLSQQKEETLPLEVMTQAFIQDYVHPSLDEIAETLRKLEESGSKFAGTGLGWSHFKSAKYEEAYEKLSSAMTLFPTFLPGWIMLCKSALKLHKHSNAKDLAKRGLMEYKLILNGSKPFWLLPIMSLDDVQFELSKCLANALCGSHIQEEVTAGVETFQKLLAIRPEDVELHIGMALGYIKLGKYTQASDSLNKALEGNPDGEDATAWKAFVECKAGSLKDGLAALQSISPPTPLSLFLLGKCMWDADGQLRKDKKNCFTALVKAAKLDPNLGETFLLLGHFYSKVQRDNARAKGCYQKSYQLDPGNEETAACLADTYVAEGDTGSAIELYRSITKELGSAGGKWAWLRLGLYQLKSKDMTNAIQSFQSALRIDAENSICWECLGEGYLQRGSYTAAWKAFDRAHQLNPQSLYSLYQMAKVKQVQGLYQEAISEFSDVLELFSDYVPALQGLGESELLLSKQMFQEGRFGTGLERMENAIMNLTKACCLRKDLCCLWKLLGDCCVMVHSLNGSVVSIKVPTVLLSNKDDQTDVAGSVEVGKSQLLSLGTRFYCRAVHLQSENSTLWHDLGVGYFRQAEECGSGHPEYAAKAMNAVKKAITIETTNPVFWCTLGVIAASKYIKEPALAQHCFLTSIKNEKNNVQAWSNLATLYLAHDHVKMAHEAFKVAQSLEPSFTNSWVGQAIIAETVGSDETMDLYRHSTELGLQKQGAAGYASWVVKVMADMQDHNSAVFKSNIRDMNAVSTALTQMSKMSTKNPTCWWMSTFHGFLLEQSSLNQSAENAYQLAYDSMTHICETEDDEAEFKVRRKICAVNLARTLCKNGKLEKAIDLYDEISENMDVRDACGLALAYYKSQQFEKAFESYKKAGQLAASEDEKVEIMVAMAMVYWKMRKPDEAKTLLYQCFQNSKPGLKSLLSLGIALGDNTLVGAAVGEMIKKLDSSNEDEIYDDCLLVAAATKLVGDPKMGLNVVQKALHRNPSSWSLRALLSRLLVDFKGFHSVLSAPSFSTHAERLFKQHSHSHPLHRDSELWKSCLKHIENVEVDKTSALSAVSAGCEGERANLCEQVKDRLQKAQKFAHMHPYDPSSWRLLSCACHGRNVANWLNMEQNFEADTFLTTALASHAKRIAKTTENGKVSDKWLQEIKHWDAVLNSTAPIDSDETISDTKFISLLGEASRTKDKSKLQPLLKDITATMGNTSKPGRSSRYFAELLNYMKMQQVSRKMLEKSISLISANPVEKLSTQMRLFQLLYNVAMKDETKRKEMEGPLKNTTTEIVALDPKSVMSVLFQALAARYEKNHRKAKSFFNRVINSTGLTDDKTRSVAIWYLYRTLHERNDASEIEKLVDKALGLSDPHVAKIVELLPPS